MPGMSGGITTLPGILRHLEREAQRPDLFRVRGDSDFHPISTAEFSRRVRGLSLGLTRLGLGPGVKVALLSENRPEWIIADLAVLCAGGTTGPIDTPLLPGQIEHLLEDSECEIIICSTPELWLKVETVRTRLPRLARAVLIEGAAPGALSFDELIIQGEADGRRRPGAFEQAAAAVRPGDPASIIYTSGTTGNPKGVVLSHGNLIANIRATDAVIRFDATDTSLSFLPLSHVLERMTTYALLSKGASIAYGTGVESVADDMLEARPTVMVSVPRVFEKMYAKIMDQVFSASALSRRIFFWSLSAGRQRARRIVGGKKVPRRLALRWTLARRLVFGKILARTGGRIRYFVCGGAPLSEDIAEFFYAVGLLVLPGYGLTETSPILSGNTPEVYRFGTVGKPLPGVELRIAEDGEILARGPNVMLGYYKKEAETREVMEGGWFHTGDIGSFDKDGFLTVTDRKKDLIVTSGGKNVAPQPIESRLLANPYIRSVMVVGNGRKFISALIVPEFEKLATVAREWGIEAGSPAELVEHQNIADFMLAEVQRATPELAAYERIRKIVLLDRDFDLGAGEITPTMKVRRSFVEREFKGRLDALYDD
jgi:long-chain acyl-CoA synthetase